MKRDLKPFVVEVKRGTKRSSFLGHPDQSSTMSEAQRRAEATLFAPAPDEAPPKTSLPESSRRILPSLIQPAAAPERSSALSDESAPEDRPRRVGRPRKPRPLAEPARSEPARPGAMMEPAPPAPASPAVQPAAVDPLPAKESVIPARSAVFEDRAATPSGGRVRLRDRSAILARYVLGTKPAPGQRWSRLQRRATRERSE